MPLIIWILCLCSFVNFKLEPALRMGEMAPTNAGKVLGSWHKGPGFEFYPHEDFTQDLFHPISQYICIYIIYITYK